MGYEDDENQIVIAESQDEVPMVAGNDKDNQILSNIDMIIQNLQEQKGRFVTQSGLFDLPKDSEKKGTQKIQIAVEQDDEDEDVASLDPIAALNEDSRMNGLRLKEDQQPP